MTNKAPDGIAQELVGKHFPTTVYENMTERQKECVRSCIEAALIAGACQVIFGGEDNQLVRAMAEDAKEFEKTVDHLTDTTRVPSSSYPWGWRYEDSDVQKKFREFCQRKEVVVGYSPPVVTNPNAT